MRYYFAPMEGITLYPLRNIHKKYFGENIDKYYTAFLTAPQTHHFKKREKRDILPDNAADFDAARIQTVPQIMAGNAGNFIWAAKEILAMGYGEVNLNMGCPVATVTNSRKGAGLLTDTGFLDEMFCEIFDEKELAGAVSVKTRLGFYDESEAYELMKILAKYPIKELIIHARVREDFYKNEARTGAFFAAVKVYREHGGKASLCYNGDILCKEDVERLVKMSKDSECAEIDSCMIGRGLLQNPALVREICGGAALTNSELKQYLNELYEGYAEYIDEDRNVIYKLLEHWAFLANRFDDSEKYIKAIRKSRSRGEYMAAVNNLFANTVFS